MILVKYESLLQPVQYRSLLLVIIKFIVYNHKISNTFITQYLCVKIIVLIITVLFILNLFWVDSLARVFMFRNNDEMFNYVSSLNARFYFTNCENTRYELLRYFYLHVNYFSDFLYAFYNLYFRFIYIHEAIKSGITNRLTVRFEFRLIKSATDFNICISKLQIKKLEHLMFTTRKRMD